MTGLLGRNLLLGVTGGIAAYKAPELVRRLRDAGFEVRCALTPAARSFVSPLTLEVVSGGGVYGEEYLSPTGSGEELHIALAEWADLVLVAPATAHFLSSLALGLAENFLLTTILAFEGPVQLAPAMHSAMWRQPAVRARVVELEARGVELVGPVTGALASGEIGAGRMAEVADLVAAVERRLRGQRLEHLRFLITAGPTLEPLDPVRFLGNRSSGKMGFALAAAAATRGARVDLVAGPVGLETPAGVARVDVETAQEMAAAVHERAGAADVIVMAAAVADFRPRVAAERKLKKSAGPPEIELVANPDILERLAEWAPAALRVGFAAETGDVEAEAQRKLEQKSAHLLIANDVARADIGFSSDDNEVTLLFARGEKRKLPRQSKQRLARELVEVFVQELGGRRDDDPQASG